MTNLYETFFWRVAIIASIVAALIVVAMLARAIGALRHKIRSRDRHGSQTPVAETRPPMRDAVELAPPRHSSFARRTAAADTAQTNIFRDAA